MLWRLSEIIWIIYCFTNFTVSSRDSFHRMFGPFCCGYFSFPVCQPIMRVAACQWGLNSFRSVSVSVWIQGAAASQNMGTCPIRCRSNRTVLENQEEFVTPGRIPARKLKTLQPPEVAKVFTLCSTNTCLKRIYSSEINGICSLYYLINSKKVLLLNVLRWEIIYVHIFIISLMIQCICW